MPKNDDYSGYPPEAKQLATALFSEGMSVNNAISVMRETYPRISRATLNNWSISDEAFGVIYRNGIASKAQAVVVESMEQLEVVFTKSEQLLDDADSEGGINTDKATVLRLMMDTARHKKTTALMLLGKINKNYSDKISSSHSFQQTPLVNFLNGTIEETIKAIEASDNGNS